MGCQLEQGGGVGAGTFGNSCFQLDIDLSLFLNLAIDLPGGVQLTAKLDPGGLPDIGSVVAKLLGELNAALTPLIPIFRIIDVCIAIYKCMTALTDALGPPPDPSKLVKCVKNLKKAIAFLLSLIPVLSVPLMIVSICKLIVAGLKALRGEIICLTTVNASLDAGRLKAVHLAQFPEAALGAAALEANIDCAQFNLDLQLECMLGGLQPLNRLIDLINIFSEMAHLGELIKLDFHGDASAILTPLDDAIIVLDTFCGSIPV